MRALLKSLCGLIALSAASLCWAQKGSFLTAEEFYAQVFTTQAQTQVLWLDKTLQDRAEQILGHRFRGMRARYFTDGERSAWIFDEIGKTHPITIGVAVAGRGERAAIERVRILEFRESRGGEVRYDNFTRQFERVGLDLSDPEVARLDSNIDGITGATLSVRAVQKVATLALFFHRQTPVGKELEASAAPTP